MPDIYGLIYFLPALAAGLVLRHVYRDFPLDDDFGFYAYLAKFRKGKYKDTKPDFWFFYFPTYIFYRLVFMVSGGKVIPRRVRQADAFVELVTAGSIILFFGLSSFDLKTGAIAAGLYFVFSAAPSIGLVTGPSERYFSPIVIWGYGLIGAAFAGQAEGGLVTGLLVLSGAVFGLLVSFKDILAFHYLLGTASAVITASVTGGGALSGFMAGIAVTLGFIPFMVLGLMPTVIAQGGFKKFVKWKKRAYARTLQDNADRGSLKKLAGNFAWFAGETLPLWLIPLAVFPFAIGNMWGEPAVEAGVIVLFAWLVGTAGVFFAQGVFWPYHFYPLVPLLSVIGAVLAAHAGRGAWQLAVILAITAVSVIVSGPRFWRAFRAGANPAAHGRDGVFTAHKVEQLEAVPRIAEFLKENTQAGDYIYQWGYLYHLYILADRECPVPMGISLRPPTRHWHVDTAREIMTALRYNPPKYIVVHLQDIDISVITEFTGLRYEFDRVFSTGLRVYRLVERIDILPVRTPDEDAVRRLLSGADHSYGLARGLIDLPDGDLELADRHLTDALRLNPVHVLALEARAEILERRGMTAKAADIYNLFGSWDSREVRNFGAVKITEMLRRVGKSIDPQFRAELLDSAVTAVDPFDLMAVNRVGNACRQAGDRERELKLLTGAAQVPVTLENRSLAVSRDYHIGRAMVELGRFAEAEPYLLRCLKWEQPHRSAEEMLNRAVTGRDRHLVRDAERVLVFRSAQKRYLDPILARVREDFPGREIALVCQPSVAREFEPAHCSLVDRLVRFAHKDFLVSHLLRKDVRKQLGREKPDAVIIPSMPISQSGRVYQYLNIFLYILMLGGRPKLIYFYPHTTLARRRFQFGEILELFTKKVLETLAMPVWLMHDLAWLVRNRSRYDESISLSSGVNDLIAHLVKGDWISKYGYYGVSPSAYLGSPYSLYYPPVAYTALNRLGPGGYAVFQTSFFAISLAFLAVTCDSPLLFLSIPYLVSSWYYRQSALIVGRFDFTGWSMGIIALALAKSGHFILGGLFFGGTVMIHTTIAFLTAAAAAVLILPGGEPIARLTGLAEFGSVAAAVSAWWWIPFFINRKKFGFHRIWGGIAFWGNVWLAYKPSARRMTIFLLACLLFGGYRTIPMLALIPYGIYVYGILRQKYVFHVVILDGAFLALGAVSMAVTPLAIASLPLFLILVNMIDIQDYPRVNPMAGERFLRQAEEFYAPLLPATRGDRVAVECNPANFWDDNVSWGWLHGYAAEKLGFSLLGGVGFDQVDAVLPLEYEIKINPDAKPLEILRALERTACGYVASYSAELDEVLLDLEFTRLSETEFDNVGYLDGRKYTLWRAPFTPQLAEPMAEVHIGRNEVTLRADRPGEYLLKIAYYPGWRASFDRLPLEIRDAAPGMIVTVPEEGTVDFRYEYKSIYRARRKTKIAGGPGK